LRKRENKDFIRILEVGCAAGLTGFELKRKKIADEVVGLEINKDVSKIASLYLDKVITANVEEIEELPFPKKYFDCILFLDVLEHLIDPWKTLKKLRDYLKNDGIVVASIPNIRHHSIITSLVLGRWEYQDAGILDRTHLRFFTFPEMKKLMEEAGLKISEVQRILTAEFNSIKNSLAEGITQNIDIGPCILKNQTKESIEDLFTYQYLIAAVKSTG